MLNPHNLVIVTPAPPIVSASHSLRIPPKLSAMQSECKLSRHVVCMFSIFPAAPLLYYSQDETANIPIKSGDGIIYYISSMPCTELWMLYNLAYVQMAPVIGSN